jgi:hypothetical protein
MKNILMTMVGEVSYLNDLDVQNHFSTKNITGLCEQRKPQSRTTEDGNLFGIGNDFPLKLKPSMDTELITSLVAIIFLSSQIALARNPSIGLALICWLECGCFTG